LAIGVFTLFEKFSKKGEKSFLECISFLVLAIGSFDRLSSSDLVLAIGSFDRLSSSDLCRSKDSLYLSKASLAACSGLEAALVLAIASKLNASRI